MLCVNFSFANPVLELASIERYLIDSIPANETQKKYLGMRVHLHDIQVSKLSEDWFKISFIAINTGREDLRFGELHLSHLKNLLVNYDDSFADHPLAPFQAEIEENLKYQDLTVLAGKMLDRKEMKVKVQGVNQLKAAADVVLTDKGSGKKKQQGEDSFSINVGNSDENEPLYDKNTCPDLAIDSIRIIKVSKNSVTLEYTITNHGKGPANMMGHKKALEDNVAIKAHMGSSGKLNRGAISLGGSFIKNLPKEKNGLLEVNESLTGTIKLALHKMTRFTPVIILELDTYQSVRECNERNNRNHIKLDRE